jgi:predicted MPP superfamily phosphohydrolase
MAEEHDDQGAAAGSRPAARSRVRGYARRLHRAVTGPGARQFGAALAIIGVAVVGVILGTLLGARTKADIGPFRAQMQLTPSLVGGTEVQVPPLGSLHLDSHEGPAHLTVRFDELDQRRTEALINDPNGVSRASEGAVGDATRGAIRLGLRTLGATVLTAMALGALVFRDVRRVAWCGAFALAITMSSLASAVGTYRVNAIEEPRYEGLLVNAPAVLGDARRINKRYDAYAAQLQGLVNNVSQLYTVISTLPVFQAEPGTTRVLHVSDLHLNPTAWSVMKTVVEQFDIDLVVDTGDITDWGSEPEASFVSAIRDLRVPYVYVRGNHDSAVTAAAVARQPNAIVLDNSVRVVAGLTVAGIGDPRFTPDKETWPEGSSESRQGVERLNASGEQLAATIAKAPFGVDVALVHDPASAGGLSGACPLVLAGHLHHREVRMLGQVPGKMPTQLLVAGSTGGAGLRGIREKEPPPLSMSVLYFDPARSLKAYDDIEVGGTGRAQVTLERHVVKEPATQPAGGLRPRN